MSWSNQEIRKMLALLGKPSGLEKFPLAVQLREVVGAATAREAVLQVIAKAFDVRTPLNDALRETIFRCDVEGTKSLSAASSMGVSPRTLFRWRSAAITEIAVTVDRMLQTSDSQSQFKYAIARMIAPVESATAAQLLEKEAETLGGRAAYESICTALRNGRDVSDALLERCTGHWRLLAQLEIARTNLVRGKPGDYEKMRAEIRASLDCMQGVPYERVEYELAYIDRLNAVRLCDVMATGSASRRMSQTAGSDPALVTFALVCQAEQVCDEGDLNAADTLIRKLQLLCLRMRDYRITARTSHVAAILQFLRGRYSDAIELAHATTAALKQVEPEFAACSAGNAGRAALFVGQSWKRPLELCSRFPKSYVTGYVDAVWARHLAFSDPELALIVIDRAIAVTSEQEAWGVLTCARATRSIILDLLKRASDAQAERIWAWEKAVRLRRVFYLYDLFVHPSAYNRSLGAFDLDEPFIAAVSARFANLCNAIPRDESQGWLRQVLAACINSAREASKEQSHAQLLIAAPLLRRSLRRLNEPARRKIEQSMGALAADLAYCLPPPRRPRFVERFGLTFASLLGGGKTEVIPTSVAN